MKTPNTKYSFFCLLIFACTLPALNTAAQVQVENINQNEVNAEKAPVDNVSSNKNNQQLKNKIKTSTTSLSHQEQGANTNDVAVENAIPALANLGNDPLEGNSEWAMVTPRKKIRQKRP